MQVSQWKINSCVASEVRKESCGLQTFQMCNYKNIEPKIHHHHRLLLVLFHHQASWCSVTLQACIWKVSSLNLDWDKIHPQSGLLWFLSVSPSKCHDYLWIIFIPSFTSHIIFDALWSDRLRVPWKSSINE